MSAAIELLVVAIAPDPLRHVEWITYGSKLVNRVPVLIIDVPMYVAAVCARHQKWESAP